MFVIGAVEQVVTSAAEAYQVPVVSMHVMLSRKHAVKALLSRSKNYIGCKQCSHLQSQPLGRLGQEHHKCKALLGNLARSCVKIFKIFYKEGPGNVGQWKTAQGFEFSL